MSTLSSAWLAQAQSGDAGVAPILLAAIPALVLVAFVILVRKRYRRCPPNRVLVVFGKLGGNVATKCVHGGGAFVWPIVQDYAYLSLAPVTIEVDLRQALTRPNVPVDAVAAFTIGVSTRPDVMQNAAERLLGVDERQILDAASDIILGRLRLVIGTLTIEEIDEDRARFEKRVVESLELGLNKIGFELLDVNFRSFPAAAPPADGEAPAGGAGGGALGLEGRTGRAASAIPAPGQGRGQVALTASGAETVLDAVSEGDAIESGARVKVVAIEVREMLVVQRA